MLVRFVLRWWSRSPVTGYLLSCAIGVALGLALFFLSTVTEESFTRVLVVLFFVEELCVLYARPLRALGSRALRSITRGSAGGTE